MKHPKLSHAFEVVAELPEALKPLNKLAQNFAWTWHHETRELFRSIDKDGWEAVEHNPVLLINNIPVDRREKLAQDQAFLQRLSYCEGYLDEYLGARTWFDEHFSDMKGQMTVAYFCAEFGLSESLPIYSGGLGVLAGDHLKAASDLGLPLVGVGLLYSRGYFRQRLTEDGWQQEVYPEYDFYQMPIKLMRGANNQALRVEVQFPDRVVTCQIWKAEVGRIQLYLLDSNVLENAPNDKGITDTLYGGDEEMRLRQEMILGIGGMRALRALGITPTVCHMNEGHAGFLTLERIRQVMADHRCEFRTARQVVAASNVFTTHTPVPAGFDLFHPELLEKYMSRFVEETGITFDEFIRLGKLDAENEGEAFNMAVLAMKNANYINGVAQLHAHVTREMFAGHWPDFPEDEVPIIGITNGIHTMTWVARSFADLYDEYLGPIWRSEPQNPEAWAGVDNIPDEELWSAMENQRGDLIRFVRKRLQRDLERRHMTRADFGMISNVLDPRVLTIGFARRFATYKRASLMLTDKERLLKMLFHAERPIQIVLAGKAHPRDEGGKKLIQDLVRFIESEGARNRMVFLEDYDMRVARAMVQGVDVWLNNPRRPLEASGTSGMKVVPNGGLNCSILDGWWDEGYQPGNGFKIGERTDSIDPSHQDWLDSRALYSVLEHEVAAKFYNRLDSGLPTAWLQMVRQSIKQLAPFFNTQRMVADYASKFYVSASRANSKLTMDGLKPALEVLTYRDRIRAAWNQVKIQNVTEMNGISHAIGSEFEVKADVALGTLSPDDVRVQVVVGKIGPNRDLLDASVEDMTLDSSQDGTHSYTKKLKCGEQGYRGYTVRVVPHHANMVAEHELSLVRWEGS
jgi:starch phosphorylase